ncbi:MAG: hypothetical protein ABL918_09850 [Chakrabartia sp.]
MMLARLTKRGADIGQRAVADVLDGIVEAAAAELSQDIKIERSDTGITLTGRKLRRRMLSDVRLRSIKYLAKRILR